MLIINNNEYKILNSEIKFANSICNKKKGYSILVSLDIELNDKKGYVSFYVDFFDTIDFKIIENKKYIESPTNLDSKISLIEIFDTFNFYDFIDSEVILEFGAIENNQIKIDFKINDELVKLTYSGKLDIV